MTVQTPNPTVESIETDTSDLETVFDAPPESTEGSKILDSIDAYYARFIKLPSEAARTVVALWEAHTYMVDSEEKLAFPYTPRLIFTSDVPGSGKSTAMEMALMFSRNGLMVGSSITHVGLAKSIHELHHVMGIDEADVLFGRGGGHAEIRGVLNDGYKEGAKMIRANGIYNTFSPVTLAGYGPTIKVAEQLKTLRERAIIVDMVKARGDVERYRKDDHQPQLNSMRHDLERWATCHTREVVTARPDLPEGLHNRSCDVWEPLFQVAAVMGGDWPERVNAACRQLVFGENETVTEIPISDKLVRDLKIIFLGATRLSSATIVDRLYEVPNSEWKELWPDDVNAMKSLANLLDPLGIGPKKVRVNGVPLQGYEREQFEDVWIGLPDAQPAEEIGDEG